MVRSRNPTRDCLILKDLADGLDEDEIARRNGVSAGIVRRIKWQQPGVIKARHLRAGMKASWNAKEHR